MSAYVLTTIFGLGGSRCWPARVLPVIAFQGDKDTTVSPVNADQLIEQWRLTADLSDDDVANGSIAGAPTATVNGQVPDGRTYAIRYYADAEGRGCRRALRFEWRSVPRSGGQREVARRAGRAL